MNRSQAWLAAAAVLAAAFFVNLIFGALGTRADLTADRTFTLSPGSRRIITRLDEPVTLEFFVSRSDVKLRPHLESYSRRIETLLREYVAASGGKVRLIVTDPRPDTKEEQRAQRHGIAALRAAQGSAYLGLTAQQADSVKALPMLDPSRERFLEFDLSKLLGRLAPRAPEARADQFAADLQRPAAGRRTVSRPSRRPAGRTRPELRGGHAEYDR
jgi:ABC-type uncharacterized transport system involved in gliding motility auxiliary subunit